MTKLLNASAVIVFLALAMITVASTPAAADCNRQCKANEKNAQGCCAGNTPVAKKTTPQAGASEPAKSAGEKAKPAPSGRECRSPQDCLADCESARAQGCRLLGSMYENGVGVALDAARAESFYQRACLLKDTRGCDKVMEGHVRLADDEQRRKRDREQEQASKEEAKNQATARCLEERTRCSAVCMEALEACKDPPPVGGVIRRSVCWADHYTPCLRQCDEKYDIDKAEAGAH